MFRDSLIKIKTGVKLIWRYGGVGQTRGAEGDTMKVTGVLAEKGLHVFDQEGRIHAGHVALRVWILVADHAKAKLYRKADHHFQEIACMESKSHHHHQDDPNDGREQGFFAVNDPARKQDESHVQIHHGDNSPRHF